VGDEIRFGCDMLVFLCNLAVNLLKHDNDIDAIPVATRFAH
jgi:hypothetical protein